MAHNTDKAWGSRRLTALKGMEFPCELRGCRRWKQFFFEKKNQKTFTFLPPNQRRLVSLFRRKDAARDAHMDPLSPVHYLCHAEIRGDAHQRIGVGLGKPFVFAQKGQHIE